MCCINEFHILFTPDFHKLISSSNMSSSSPPKQTLKAAQAEIQSLKLENEILQAKLEEMTNEMAILTVMTNPRYVKDAESDQPRRTNSYNIFLNRKIGTKKE